MNDKYVLNGHEAVVEPDLIKWATRFETTNRTVRKTLIDSITISTVFLGIDHRIGEGKPLLFETKVFGGPLDQECERCSTWEEAEQMHKQVKLAVQELEKGFRASTK